MASNPVGGIDEQALGAELEWIVPGFIGLQSVHKYDTGQSNPTYRVEAMSGRYVLRAKPAGPLLKSAHQVDREYRVMAALADTSVPVPRVLALAGEASALGRMYFVMAHVEGRIFWDPALPGMEADERSAIYAAMNAVLADLHALDPGTIGLSDFGKPGNYFARQVSRWSSQYRASETEAIADMDGLIAWLEANLPPDDGAVSLVHGDFRLDNMIFAPDAPRVAALLDWELSTLGHPVADLAYQCMQWRLPHESRFKGLGGIDREALGIPSEEAYVADYCTRRGLEGVANWNFALAFSFFRLASILQGVVKRALDGTASNAERARELAPVVPMLARMAADLIAGEGRA